MIVALLGLEVGPKVFSRMPIFVLTARSIGPDIESTTVRLLPPPPLQLAPASASFASHMRVKVFFPRKWGPADRASPLMYRFFVSTDSAHRKFDPKVLVRTRQADAPILPNF